MRIDKRQRIAGLQALDARRLIRKIGESCIDLDATAHILRQSRVSAKRALDGLARSGLLVESTGKYKLTSSGRSLAAATAARPLLRDTAERLITGLLTRARLTNEDETFAFCVEVIAIFGSASSDAERPSDVDIGCELVPRWENEQLQAAHEDIRRNMRGRFGNTLEWAYWPQLEVLRYLKNRSKSLPIHTFEEAIKIDPKCRILYRREPENDM
jgi:hypothetical protein